MKMPTKLAAISANIAMKSLLPIVFVCQNNGWAISEPLASYVATSTIAERARGYGIPGVVVDGNDPIAVNDAVQAAVQRARGGDGPTLIEARTYRLAGHWAEDAASYRTEQEVQTWQAREPIAATARALMAQGISHDDLIAVENDVRRHVNAAFAEARALPAVGASELGADEVYAS